MADAPELSIVIPAYNEAARLPRTIETIVRYLSGRVASYEIIVVDDGSRDATAEVARRALESIERSDVIRFERNRGKGAAVRAGMLRAQGDHILFSDADLSTPIEEEARLRQALREGADVAIGSRALAESDITLAQSAWRQWAGRSVNALLRLLGLTSSHDTQCGFKVFTRAAAHELFSRARIEGFLFDVEILFLAQRAGLRVAELPVRWHNDPDSRVSLVRHLPRIVVELIKLRLRA